MSFDHIIVIGAGAVGAPLAALLSRAHDVLVVERGEQLRAIQENGIQLKGERNQTFDVKATGEIATLSPNTLVFLCTKAYDTEAALSPLREKFLNDTVLCLFQNGLGIEETARVAAGERPKIVRAVVRMGSEAPSPGVVRFSTYANYLPQTPEGEAIAELLQECGMGGKTVSDFPRAVWEKAVVNCIFNPLSALLNATDSELVTDSLKPLRRALARECMAVASEEGVEISSSLPERMDEGMKQYHNVASMHQDIAHRRRTEIDVLNGYIVEKGLEYGLPVTANEAIVACIRFLEESVREN